MLLTAVNTVVSLITCARVRCALVTWTIKKKDLLVQARHSSVSGLHLTHETLFSASSVRGLALPLFGVLKMGFSRDFEELCAVVQKRDAKSPALGKLKVVLENLCNV